MTRCALCHREGHNRRTCEADAVVVPVVSVRQARRTASGLLLAAAELGAAVDRFVACSAAVARLLHVRDEFGGQQRLSDHEQVVTMLGVLSKAAVGLRRRVDRITAGG